MTSSDPAPITRPRSRKPLWRRPWFAVAMMLLLMTGGWTLWAEFNPDREHALRTTVQQRLHQWFPEQMAPGPQQAGFVPRSKPADAPASPDVILVHGLDEPGGIWDALVEALDSQGINAWEFRYPNDQAVVQSADLLAELWTRLPADQPVALIGHSMGGLVVRDFVSRWRHPENRLGPLDGAPVSGVVLVGTPNQGSDWARLRVWLELREYFADASAREFSLFASLRDGTGAAKIDLRPGSAFLQALNARGWPECLPMRQFGGRLTAPTEAMQDSVEALSAEPDDADFSNTLNRWWQSLGQDLGDGVVSIDSLSVPGAPDPVIFNASHRGLLAPGVLSETPPAIEPIVDAVQHWRGTAPCDA